MVAVFSLDILELPFCPLFLQCLFVPTKLPGTFPRTADHLYEPRLWLAEEVFILGLTFWAVMIKTDFFIY